MISKVDVNKTAVLSGHTGAVYALEMGADQNSVYSGSSDKIIAQWDLANPGDGSQVARSTDIVYSILNVHSNNKLLIGLASGSIHVLNQITAIEERQLNYHQSSIFSLTSSVKNNFIFSLSGDGELGVMDLLTLELKSKLLLGNFKLRIAALSPDEKLIAVGAGNGAIYVFSLPDMKPVKHWQAHNENFSVNALHFTPDGSQLLSGSRDAHLNIYDANKDFELLNSIPAHNYAIYSIVFNPEGTMFATASRDKTIKIWDTEDFRLLKRIDADSSGGHVNSVNKLLWHPHTNFLLSGSDDRSILVWEIKPH